MYSYKLIDGVVVHGELVTDFTITPLSDEQKTVIDELVERQHAVLLQSKKFEAVTEQHALAVKGVMTLNEYTSASISSLGDESVNLSFDDLCDLKVSAQDWNVILTSSMACDEFHNSSRGSIYV
ncbi:6-phospho-beta-glucosidase [Aliivibrio fischeri]